MARPVVQSEGGVIQDRDDANRIMRRAQNNTVRDRDRNAEIVSAASRLYLLLARETAFAAHESAETPRQAAARALEAARASQAVQAQVVTVPTTAPARKKRSA